MNMERQISEMKKAVKDFQDSNEVIQERLNRLNINKGNVCSFEQTSTIQKEVKQLGERVSAMENDRTLRQNIIKQLGDQVNEMKEKVNTFSKNVVDMTDESERPTQRSDSAGTSRARPGRPATGDVEPSVTNDVDAGNESSTQAQATSRTGTSLDDDRPSDKTSRSQVTETTNDDMVRRKNARNAERVKSASANSSEKGDHVDGGDMGFAGARSNTISDRSRPSGNKEIVTPHAFDVVKQPISTLDDPVVHWKIKAQVLMDTEKHRFHDIRGVHTVICLDISESMTKGNAWKEALRFLNDYLNGLEEMSSTHGMTDEYVGLVMFGHKTDVALSFTLNYDSIRQAISEIRLGGPSSIYGGFLLAVAVAGSSEYQVHTTTFGVRILSKIILITDGHLTENSLVQGPDVCDESKLDESKSALLSLLSEFPIDIVCVPVGQESNTDFFQLLSSERQVQILDSQSGKRLSRNYYLHTKTTSMSDMFGLLGGHTLYGNTDTLSSQDMEDIRRIQERQLHRLLSSGSKMNTDMYREGSSPTLPVIGSRVRRGPEWHWGNQDSHGPGTVVGHAPDDRGVWVTWDENDQTNIYEYSPGNYCVLIVEEPRQLSQWQTLEVGCIVRCGKNWKDHSKSYTKGVIIRKLDKDKVEVRWENAERGIYSFNGHEIEVWTPGIEPFKSQGHVLGY